MSHDHDCGHTDEEHAKDMMEALFEAATTGDFYEVYATMPSDLLLLNIERLLAEMFVRANDDEAFNEFAEVLSQEIVSVLVNGEGPTSAREDLLALRAKRHELVEQEAFEREAGAEIAQLLDAQGVVETAPAEFIADDGWPGQYL